MIRGIRGMCGIGTLPTHTKCFIASHVLTEIIPYCGDSSECRKRDKLTNQKHDCRLPTYIFGYVEQIKSERPRTVLMNNCPQKLQGKRKLSKKMLFFSMERLAVLTLESSEKMFFSLDKSRFRHMN